MKKLSMKKNAVAAMVVMSIFAATNMAHAATLTQTDSSSWHVTANKLSSASLAVNPTGSLPVITFTTENVGTVPTSTFSTADAPFEVVLGGDASATAFTLTANTIAGQTRLASTLNSSYLEIGVAYNSTPLTTASQTTIFSNGTTSGAFAGLASTALNNGVTAAGDKFVFSVASFSADGTNVIANPNALPNTTWSGNIGVQFTATWTVPA